MGYRNYLGKVSKTKYEELKDLTEDELIKSYGDDDNWFDAEEISGYKELYEPGKDCDFDENKIQRFFTHKMNFESDIEFSLGSKDFLLYIIENYRDKVKAFYINLETKTEKELRDHAKTMRIEWVNLTPYNIDENVDTIVDSWKYEYEIFELVRIYKTFDWKNDVLVYTGG